jgi:hypothetical protein
MNAISGKFQKYPVPVLFLSISLIFVLLPAKVHPPILCAIK